MTAEISIQSWFDARAAMRHDFLVKTGWIGARLTPVGEDCAFRRYFRLQDGDKTAILMETVPDKEGTATPGHKMSDYIRIGSFLRTAGLNTPDIYDVDEKDGYILLEDFGDISFKHALEQGVDESTIYGTAIDVLKYMRDSLDVRQLHLPDYYNSHVHKGRRRVIDWFVPAVTDARNAVGLAESYLDVWNEIEATLPPCPQGFLHIDFHVLNLMWLPQRDGLQKCGILDFQGAMKGPVPYDLANILEDARRGLSSEMKAALLDRFCEGMNGDEKELMKRWYRILATQFHCRVIGQFIRLAVKDGKPRYLKHIPRVAGYIEDALVEPVLKPLKEWFDGQGVDFKNAPDTFDVSTIKPYIRDDAF